MLVIILQVITVAISLTSLVLGVWNTIRENKKNRYVEIVTKQRLDNKSKVSSGAKVLLQYVSEETKDFVDNDYIKLCSAALSEIKAVLKPCYPEDLDVIQSGERLLRAYVSFVQNEGDFSEIENAGLLFYQKYSVYDLADWRFIKKQAKGDESDSDDFDTLYRATEKEFR